ncbi:lipase family protein [Nitrosomonas ureae]|uniref:lipase family protein n=1 Tax=Nitrosomonas ureae TaxID=44577 RepID=UPI000944B03F|nr:hypothetical protein [Nitrosomonas ureae]
MPLLRCALTDRWSLGGGQHGGNSSSVASALNGTIDVIQIYSTGSAFAALRTDGSVITWGNVPYGGDSSSVASQLSSGVISLSNIYTDESFSATVSPNTLPTADALFELEGVTGGDDGDDSNIGSLEAGKIKVMADFSKAAYDLQSWENLSINDSIKYSDEAVTYIENKGWEPVNLTPTLKSLDTYFYIPTLSSITTTNQMQDGFYTNYNAAAFVARSNDAIVISFRGTNDNGQFSSPDVSDWTDKSAHYDLMRPLVEAVESYIVAEGIHKVYVTGHSLGGAMAIKFMNDHANRSFGADYEAITFATASYDLRGTNDPRMTLIEIAGDPVADTGIDNGRNIHFVGDKTIGVSSHFHSMDYYRQMVDSVDNVAWDRILNETGDQSVYIGGQRGISGEEDYFIVDGRLSGVNSVVPNSGNDTLTAPLFANYNIYYGGRGIDKLTGGGAKELMLGGSGNDVLKGMGGIDRLFGDSGNDMLNGGAGADTMVGGLGNDTFVVDNVGDVVAENLNEGTDKVNSNVTYTLSANVENLTLTGTSAINGTGNGMANSITGNAGNNIISGAAGADRLFGKGGKDTLTGGSGADKFIFDTAPGTGNIDTITDFAHGIDKIMLDDDIFTALGITGTVAGAALTANKFHVGASALDTLDRIVYNSSTGALYYDVNGSGAGAAVQVALIGTSIHPTLSASDFLVIA